MLFVWLLGGKAVDIPSSIKLFLPQQGGAFISGGLTSLGRMVVFDLATRQVTLLEGDQTGQAVDSEKATRTQIALSNKDLERLEQLSRKISRSSQDFQNSQPMADFDVLLALRFDGMTRVIQSYGPPVSYVDELYTFLWNLKK